MQPPEDDDFEPEMSVAQYLAYIWNEVQSITSRIDDMSLETVLEISKLETQLERIEKKLDQLLAVRD